jgi:hypothetical protein
MSSYPMYDTLKLSDSKATNVLTYSIAKIITEINQLERDGERNLVRLRAS